MNARKDQDLLIIADNIRWIESEIAKLHAARGIAPRERARKGSELHGRLCFEKREIKKIIHHD